MIIILIRATAAQGHQADYAAGSGPDMAEGRSNRPCYSSQLIIWRLV